MEHMSPLITDQILIVIAGIIGAHTQILIHIPAEEVIRDVGKTIDIIPGGLYTFRIMLIYSERNFIVIVLTKRENYGKSKNFEKLSNYRFGSLYCRGHNNLNGNFIPGASEGKEVFK